MVFLIGLRLKLCRNALNRALPVTVWPPLLEILHRAKYLHAAKSARGNQWRAVIVDLRLFYLEGGAPS